MEDLYKEGKIRAIGVSNFEASHLDELMSYAKIKPAVNQIETHAFFQQEKARESPEEITEYKWKPGLLWHRAETDISPMRPLQPLAKSIIKTMPR